MHLRKLPLLVLTVLATAALAPAAGAAPRLRGVISTMPTQLPGAARTGAAPAAQPMTVGVLLGHPDPRGEDRLLKGLYDPASPAYHQFLTPAQYDARFGPAAADTAAVRRWLTAGGLRVRSTSRAGDYLTATGTAAAVGRLAHTPMATFSKGDTSFVGNTAAPRVPASLQVLALSGLNTLQRYRTQQAQQLPVQTPQAPAAGPPDVGNRTPQELWSIYDQPSSATGGGTSVAILGSGKTDTVIDDLHKFDAKNGFPALPVDVRHTPANGDFSDDSGNVEWNIDMQAIHGMAPGISKQVLYFSPTLADSELVASLATWVNDPAGPPIMNASLGECEAIPVVNPILNNQQLKPVNGNDGGTFPVTQAVSQNSEPATTMLLQQAVMEGRTFFAASGDNGSSCTVAYPGANGVANEAVPLTSDPASVPFATGVGGTVLYSDAAQPAGRAVEKAWEYSGGNASPFIDAPDYQKDVPNLNRPCALDANGQPTNTGKLCRGVPDVSALSGDVISNGYTIVSDGKDSGGGGTSLSSPLWAGMWARVVGAAPAGTTGYGMANDALYKIAKDPARNGESFFDITLGANGLNPALPGYDYVTGLGVPKVSGLLKNVPAVTPARAATAVKGDTCRDKLAPVSRFTASKSRLTRRGANLRGTSSDRGCASGRGALSRVAVSIGRAVGRRCKFLKANGAFGAATSCKSTVYLPARGTTRWTFARKVRLPRGSYKVYVRGIDAAANYERKLRKGNLIRLRVS